MASDRMAAWLWRAMFGRVGRWLPFAACRRIARALAFVAWHLGARRAITLRNLALAFPELTPKQRREIGKNSLANLMTVFLELLTLRYLDDRQLRRAIEVENIELLDGIDGRGALLLSGHFGNWELLAFGAAAISGVPFAIVVKEQRDYGQIQATRTARGNSVIPTSRAAREATGLLRSGGIVAMLADQAASDRDDLTTMFGVATYTFAAPARMILRFRPKVIVGFAERQRDGSYRARLEEIRHDDIPDSHEGSALLTQRYVDLLEAAIRRAPEQWVWQHRKWKGLVEY